MEDADHVYFFFRESAVEYINCGKVNIKKITRLSSEFTCRVAGNRYHVCIFIFVIELQLVSYFGTPW